MESWSLGLAILQDKVQIRSEVLTRVCLRERELHLNTPSPALLRYVRLGDVLRKW